MPNFEELDEEKKEFIRENYDKVLREKSKFEKGGRTISQTPAPKKDQVYGSSVNKSKSSTSVASAKLIKFDEKTLEAIKARCRSIIRAIQTRK